MKFFEVSRSPRRSPVSHRLRTLPDWLRVVLAVTRGAATGQKHVSVQFT